MKFVPLESHLTTLSYHINFTSNQSKLMKKNSFFPMYQLDISGYQSVFLAIAPQQLG